MERSEIKIDDSGWAERSEYWNNYRPIKRGRKKKYTFREPLVLVGHGVKIRVDHNTLLVRNGFTHYPQKSEEIRFFPGDPNLPDRMIILDASGGVTFDALNWMSDQKIAFVQLNWRGQIGFSGNSGLSARPKMVKWQMEIQGTPKAREINRQLICAKFDASIETLTEIFGGSEASKIAIRKIRNFRSRVARAGNSYANILGLEGAASAIYYRLWHDIPLRWTNLSKRPIPGDWLKVGARQMIWQRSAANARHPVNAMLNYGYGILISQVQGAIIAAGYDPSIGIAHHRHKNPIPLVYDLMEPLRPVVDRAILNFVLSHTFEPGDFTITKLGGCRLNPHLAKIVVDQMAGVKTNGIISVIG